MRILEVEPKFSERTSAFNHEANSLVPQYSTFYYMSTQLKIINLLKRQHDIEQGEMGRLLEWRHSRLALATQSPFLKINTEDIQHPEAECRQ